jgi:hypothetical protein
MNLCRETAMTFLRRTSGNLSRTWSLLGKNNFEYIQQGLKLAAIKQEPFLAFPCRIRFPQIALQKSV